MESLLRMVAMTTMCPDRRCGRGEVKKVAVEYEVGSLGLCDFITLFVDGE